ncbi:MAG TPA: peptidylprolyl isomerase [Vicinamibacterales bacterium]|nr:peptidylprolyl isomerase [Vicinamibacterales bacterium]
MTMLDRMRRHKHWLQWSLVVVVLAFIALYFPEFVGPAQTLRPSGDRLATIDSRAISVADFRRRYLAQMRDMQARYGGKLTDELLQQMQIPQQVLQQMIQEKAEISEAERAGITVSDAEVRAQIMAFPGLQEKGQFIGEERYRQLLQQQNPPLTPADFEQSVRESLMLDKFRAGLTEWMSVSDADVEREYKRRNEKVVLDVVAILADNFKAQVTPSDADISSHFDGNKESYRVPDRRKIRFVRISAADLAGTIKVSRADVERVYNERLGSYTTPEQIRASHILLTTEGKQDAAVRTQAEQVLKAVKAGGDFAALAKKHSQDASNAQQGGDLDYFARGRMVPAFETAAFALKPGETSDLVKTEFGYHIIKVTDRKPAIVRALSEPDVYKEIETQLLREQAEQQTVKVAAAIAAEAKTPQALDRAAAAHGLKVEESGFFARGGMIEGLGPQSAVSTAAFELADNTVSAPIAGPIGQVVFTVSSKQDSYLPKLDEVRSRVRDDVIATRAVALAKQRADTLAAQLKTAPNFQAAAKSAGLEAVTTNPVARDAVIPNIGRSPEIDAMAFSSPVGTVSGAISTPQGAAIVKVASRQDVNPADYAMARDKFRAELLNERRSRFYQTYMDKAREKMKVDIDPEALKRAMG